MPPIQIGGPPGRWGAGPSVALSTIQRPFQLTGLPVHSARARRSPSSMRPTRFSNGTPQATNSARILATSLAMPTPRMKRPSLIWSRVAMPCAKTTGLRSAGSSTAVPSSARLVRAATADNRVSGSCRGRARIESPTQIESYPRSSARSASANSAAASGRPSMTCSRVGSRYPIRALHIRIHMRLGAGAGVGDGALLGVADGLRVFPQRARLVAGFARRPGAAALGQLGIADRDVDRAGDGVDRDLVAVAQQRDRAADRRLRPDMADAEAVRRAGEAAVGDQRHPIADTLAVKGGGRRQHLAHAGPAARPLVADDDDVAVLVAALLDRGEGILFAIEAEGRAGKAQCLHAGDLYDRTLRRQIALQHDEAAGRRQRPGGRAHHVLPGREDDILQVLGDG